MGHRTHGYNTSSRLRGTVAVWPETAVGGLFSPVVHVLRCVVASSLAQDAMGRQPMTGILLPVQREMNIRRRRSPGVLLRRWIVELRVQTTAFAVSVKREVVVSRLKVVLQPRHHATT